MNSEFYKKITHPFQMHPRSIVILNILNKLLTLAGFIAYPALLLRMAFLLDKRFFAFLFLPAFFFHILSQIRKLINSPRPYETYEIQPLISRDGHGQSFPSRHVFSIFLIGTLWYGIFPLVGLLLCFLGIILAVIRVIGGVHFPKDVFFGALIGIICGCITLYICTL